MKLSYIITSAMLLLIVSTSLYADKHSRENAGMGSDMMHMRIQEMGKTMERAETTKNRADRKEMMHEHMMQMKNTMGMMRDNMHDGYWNDAGMKNNPDMDMMQRRMDMMTMQMMNMHDMMNEMMKHMEMMEEMQEMK